MAQQPSAARPFKGFRCSDRPACACLRIANAYWSNLTLPWKRGSGKSKTVVLIETCEGFHFCSSCRCEVASNSNNKFDEKAARRHLNKCRNSKKKRIEKTSNIVLVHRSEDGKFEAEKKLFKKVEAVFNEKNFKMTPVVKDSLLDTKKQKDMFMMHPEQVQNQQQSPVNQARFHILNRPALGTSQQQPPQQYRPAVHAQVLVAPPASIPQVPVTVRPANMLEPVRPVLELLEEENDCLGQIPLPRGEVNYVEWTPVEYAEWAKQILSGPKGEEMSEFIIKEDHKGIMVRKFVEKPQDMAELYKLNISQSLKLNAYATSTINRQKRQNYAIKMKEYEEQMRIYELPH